MNNATERASGWPRAPVEVSERASFLQLSSGKKSEAEHELCFVLKVGRFSVVCCFEKEQIEQRELLVRSNTARLDDLSELSKLLFMPRLFCPQRRQLFLFFSPFAAVAAHNGDRYGNA